MSRRPDIQPIFVSSETAAALCQISVDTWRLWVQSGYVPAPAVERGQIIRWHWPTVEAALARQIQTPTVNPFMEGVRNVQKAREAKARKEGRHRGAA